MVHRGERHVASMALSMVAFSLLFSFLIKFSVGDQDFGYDGNKGPSHWGDEYSSCVGKYQSPINIDEHNVMNVSLPPIVTDGLFMPRPLVIKNNGHTVMIKMKESSVPLFTITGGPMGEKVYIFEQLHFHWGENDLEGSEDLINNHAFPMELHAVFYNSEYGAMNEATEHSDGLVVLAQFYEITTDDEGNENYDCIVDALPKIETVDSEYEIEDQSFLQKALVALLLNQDYYTYNGSLTTPPCSEVVTWVDFKRREVLSTQQLDAFRNVRATDGTKLTHNFRPVQPIADRLIFHAFDGAENSSIPTIPPNTTDQPDSAQNMIISSVFFTVCAITISRFL